jgi:hypothetical protein
MSIIFVIVNLTLLSFISYYLSKKTTSLKVVYWLALSVKLIAGITLGLLYTYYYTTDDTFSFFKDGKTLSSLAREDFINYLKFLWRGNESFAIWTQLDSPQPRALFLTKIVSFFCLLTNDNYWIVSLYFSFIAFACLWELVNVVLRFFPALKVEVIFSFLFIPSVIFWGSGLMKEGLAMAALYFLSSTFFKIWFKERITILDIAFGLLALWVLWQLKYYYAAIFLPTVGTALFVKRMIIPLLKIKSGYVEIFIWMLILILGFAGISLLKENFHPEVLFSVIVKNYQAFQTLSEPGDAVVYNNLRPTFASMLANSPWALLSGLFRPFLWEVHNVLQLLSALENLLFVALFVFSVRNWKKAFSTDHRLLVLAFVTYVIILCIFLTLSTPNFGTLSRYRVGFLPFLVFLLSINNPLVRYLYNFIQRLFSHIVREVI